MRGVTTVTVLASLLAFIAAVASSAFATEAHLPYTTFGTATSTPRDPYPLTDPTDVAVDSSGGASNGDVYVADPSRDEQQTVTIENATGGTFTLAYEGETTGTISAGFGAEGATYGDGGRPYEIEKALMALGKIGNADVAAWGSEKGPGSTSEHIIVAFVGAAFAEHEVGQLSCDGTGLKGEAGGPTPSCRVEVTQPAAPGNIVEKFAPDGAFLLMFGENVNKTAIAEGRPEAERDVCPAAGHPSDECQYGERGTTLGAFVGETENERHERYSRLYVAVDDSPSGNGDVYVGDPGDHKITKFSEDGAAIGDWAKGGEVALSGGLSGLETFDGIAVDPNGDLFAWGPEVGDDTDLHSYEQDGAERTAPNELKAYGGELQGLAVNADEQLFHGASVEASTQDAYILEPREGYLIERFGFGCHSEEVEEAGEDFVTDRCVPLEEFAVGQLSSPEDVAVGPGSTVYVANTGGEDVAVYTPQPIEAPTATIEAPTGVFYTRAAASGEVDPHGHETTCRFEYVTEAHFQSEGFGHKLFKTEEELSKAEGEGYERPGYTPCAGDPGSGDAAIAVHAELKGLKPATSYHVRLIAHGRLGPVAYSAEPNETLTTEAVTAPTVTLEPVSGVSANSAEFVGHIDPNAPEPAPTSEVVEEGFNVKWHVECHPKGQPEHGCGTNIEKTTRGQDIYGNVAADDAAHEVAGELEELEAGTEYEVTLVATTAGFPEGVVDEQGVLLFKTKTVAPQVEGTSLVAAVGTEATVAADIRPGGLPTGYRVQYITEAAYLADGEAFGPGAQETTESASIGSDNRVHEVETTLTALTPETAYRYRVLATNELSPAGGTAGVTEAFYTYVAPVFSGCANEALREENESPGLPDCRAFELVSPPGAAEVYLPGLPGGAEDGIPGTDSPMQVAAEGNAAAYAGEAPGASSGGSGNKGPGEGDLLLSTRGAAGWSTTDITPAGEEPESYYEAFSSDLSRAIFYSDYRSLAAGVSGTALYDREDATGAFAPLFASEGSDTKYGPVTEGLAQSGQDVLFETEAALTEGAKRAATEQLGHGNVYDYAGGTLRQVNVLPGVAAKTAPDATAGGLSAEGAEESRFTSVAARNVPPVYASGDFSSDGSHAFWTDLETGVIYVRANPGREASAVEKGQCSEPEEACTAQVSAKAAIFLAATPDGRYAYYTEDGELWRFDSEDDAREALAGTGAEVQGVVAVNQTGADGSYLYFVAAGKLSSEAEARKCSTAGEAQGEAVEEAEGKAPAGRGCNLYLLHEGKTRLVSVLLPGDDHYEDSKGDSYSGSRGDWRSVLGYLTAQASPDGQTLTFMSERRLTAYPNINSKGGCGSGSHACAEVYVYSAESGQIACASCDPSGVAPAASGGEEAGEGTYLPGALSSLTHVARAISADGDRVFFTSDQSLVPADANGEPDVYEWEREGSGSCEKGSPLNGGGCVYLLSSGKPGEPGYLLEADEEGENVFLITRAQLNSFDSGEEGAALYDVRADGGFAFSSPTENGEPACTSGEACKPPPHEPPVQLFPASSAFSGPGNLAQAFELPHSEEHKGKPKLTRKQKLKRALKACRAKDKGNGKHARHERQLCERKARKKYATKVGRGKQGKVKKNRAGKGKNTKTRERRS